MLGLDVGIFVYTAQFLVPFIPFVLILMSLYLSFYIIRNIIKIVYGRINRSGLEELLQ